MEKYEHKKIEKKWREEWEKAGLYKTEENSDKPKCYVLDMFPFPSGEGLHVGHPKGYIATDVYSRFKKMNGFSILHPMGWDAFGLPAEQYAIKNKIHPKIAVEKNIARFKEQLSIIGLNYDWEREINTTDPEYYKWTQWIFLKMFEKGLAYESFEPVNWCPSCQTGLANEDLEGGACERCGTLVEKKPMRQWVLRITDYAEALLADTDALKWPESIKESQKNWIGKSEGAEIDFRIKNQESRIKVFTTRPDTLFGATYLVLAPEHPFLENQESRIKNQEEVSGYISGVKNKTEIERTAEGKEKTGVRLDGIMAINPANSEEIPVFVADYVLVHYGTGAIMAVPAHDERDFEFAKKFDLPIRQAVAPLVTLTGIFTPKEDKPRTRKNVVTAIIRRKDTDRYLLLSWKNDGCGFVGGGIDEGETPEDAIKREVKEETGYMNFDVKEIPLMSLYGHGFKYRKDVNCFDCDQVFLVEILDDVQNEISEKEKSEHKIVWVDSALVLSQITLDHHRYMWECYQRGEKAFSGNGIVINSGKFDGLISAEAKKAITEFVGGKMKTTYKLRDWVFSRQRYWGEPIPIIHCEQCKNRKQKVLLIHGFKGSAEKNSLPYLKRELEAEGFEVFVPTMTTSMEPNFEQWMEELRPYFEKLCEDDIVVGFSLGGRAAVSALQYFPKKIGHLYLVAPAIEIPSEEYWEKRKTRQPELADALDKVKVFWETPIDWAKVAGLQKNAEVLWSDDDASVLEPTRTWCPESWQIKKMNGFRHFTAQVIPELLEEILRSKNTGAIPVLEKDLPVKLPDVEFYEPTGTGKSPLANIDSWVNVKCPKCGGKAKRETNTMPNWAGSSWYYLRFIDPKNSEALVDKEKEKYWSPVDMYVGGAEHATRHLIYARFWHKFLYDIGAVNYTEPFMKLHNVGLILAEDGRKMSKRWGNVVNPDDVVEEYGADTFRVYEMFMGPFEQSTAWSTDGIIGPRRFLEKVWKLGARTIEQRNDGTIEQLNKEQETLLHQTIKKVTDDIENFKFNTAISALMIFLNALEKEDEVPLIFYSYFLILLAPFAPHMTEELWHELGNENSIHLAEWPKYDKEKIKNETMTIAVQVNGKVRASFETETGALEENIAQKALSLPDVQKWLEEKKPKKIIYVKGKLVSIAI